MKELMLFEKNEQAVVSSRVIASIFKKQHQHVTQSIENLISENSLVKSMFYSAKYETDRGREYREYLMNRDGFALLVMGFTGKEALDWKLKYIKAFNLMENAIRERQSSEWLITRKQGKLIRRNETDAIADLIVYAEEQSGYLAGYAAVKDGYKKLGFMGGIAVPAVIRFGHGFIQGADAAAKELGLTDVEMKYYYTGVFWETPEVQNRAASWFESGTEVIFSCAGGAGSSVMAAAVVNNGKVIGVDTDQSGESETVITSAVKGLAESVYQTLELYYANEFPGGTTKVFDASVKGVGLPMETSQFKTFSQEDYDAVYEKLVNGEIVVDNSIGATEEIKVEAIKVTEEK